MPPVISSPPRNPPGLMQPSLKRPRPPLAPGGSTLNMILADVTSLYSSIKPSSRLVHGAADDAYDVAALLGFRRKGLQRSPVPQGQTELCRNMRCAGRGMKPEFEEDKRHGDRICLHCGATSRLQPEREERCYVPSADDEPDENEESRQHGLGRAHGGIYKRHRVSNLMIADGFAGGLSDLGEEEQRRLMAYKGWIGSLTSHSYSDGHKVILPQVKVSALKLAEQLVCSQAEHCRRCDKPSRSNCRLAHKSKDTAVSYITVLLSMNTSLMIQSELRVRQHGSILSFYEGLISIAVAAFCSARCL